MPPGRGRWTTVATTAHRFRWAPAWAVLLALLVITTFRLTHFSSTNWEVAVLALTPWWYVGAYPVAVVAAWRQRWVVAAAASALIVVQLALIVPVWRPWSSAPPAAGTWRLRIFDANVRFDNRDLTGIAAQITAERPAVVALEELSTGNVQSLLDTGALSGYRYHLVDPATNALGFGVWSTVPLRGLRLWSVGGNPEVEGTLHPLGQAPIHLLVIHAASPVGPDEPSTWNAELGRIADKVRAEPRPLVVVGDFNATADMAQFTRITALGLDDAAVMSGNGWRMTWPANHSFIPPLARIDHLLLSNELTVTAYRVGRAAGSDHRPIIATIARAG